MPVIPTYKPNAPAGQRLDPGPSVSVAGLAAGSLSGAFEKISRFAGAMQKARDTTFVNNRKVDALARISEFEKGLLDRQDFEAFEPEFEALVDSIRKGYEKEIRDPDILSVLDNHLAGVALQKSVQVAKQARDKEISFGKAAYLSRQDDYLRLFATASEADRGRYLEEVRQDVKSTMAAGYIKPEDGVKDLSGFLSKTSLVAAEQDLRAAPETFDPDRYPFLQPDDRIRLGDQAIRLVEHTEKERVRQEEKAEKAREEELEFLQDQNARVMWVNVDKGLTIMDVEEAIQKRLVPLNEGKALKKALEAEDREENAVARFELRTALEEGRAGKREILDSFLKGDINRQTLEVYTGLYYTRQRADDASNTPEWQDAEGYIKGMLKTTGMMDAFDSDEAARIESALDEFGRRVRGGERILDVRDDIVRRYRVTPLGLNAVPKPIYGEKENPGAAFRLIEMAYQNGEIDVYTYRREIVNLKRIQEILDRMNAAPVDRKALAEKLKGRKN